MKPPTTLPCHGYRMADDGETLETYTVVRFTTLAGCSLPSITVVRPDGKKVLTSLDFLHDTPYEVLDEAYRDQVETNASLRREIRQAHLDLDAGTIRAMQLRYMRDSCALR